MSALTARTILKSATPRPLLPLWTRLEASPIGARIASGAFWSVFGSVVTRGLMLGANILVARVLTREVYGELGILRSTIGMFVLFAGFSMGVTATKHVAEFRHTDPARAGRIISLSTLFTLVSGSAMAVALIVLAPWLAGHSLNAPHLATELRIGALILVLSAMNGAQTGVLAGFEAFKTMALVELWVGLAACPLILCGAYLGGLRGTVWALAINTAIGCLLTHFALRRESARAHVLPTYAGCTREWPILWKFSFPAVLSGLMVTPVVWICNALLVNQPEGYGEMGLFDAANQWRTAILFIPGMAGHILLPMLSSLNRPKDKRAYVKVLKLNLLINGGAAVLVCVPVAFAAPWIMKSYGPDFASGRWPLIVLSLTAVLISLNAVVGQAIVSQGKMWAGFFLNSLWAVAMVLCTWWFVQRDLGALGLALANLCAYLGHTVWVSIYAWLLLTRGWRTRPLRP